MMGVGRASTGRGRARLLSGARHAEGLGAARCRRCFGEIGAVSSGTHYFVAGTDLEGEGVSSARAIEKYAIVCG